MERVGRRMGVLGKDEGGREAVHLKENVTVVLGVPKGETLAPPLLLLLLLPVCVCVCVCVCVVVCVGGKRAKAPTAVLGTAANSLLPSLPPFPPSLFPMHPSRLHLHAHSTHFSPFASRLPSRG